VEDQPWQHLIGLDVIRFLHHLLRRS
jgi:hypothetical protein